MNERVFKTIFDARKEMNNRSRYPVELTDFEVRCSCVPKNAISIEVFEFLYEFFNSNCDYPPNKADNACELPASAYSKASVYKIFLIYCGENTSRDFQPASYQTFSNIWCTVFPNVTIKKRMSVSHKCEQCLEIYKLEEKCTNVQELQKLQPIKQYHRIQVMQQKLAYYSNRREAIDWPDDCMSIIEDGMDTNKTGCPSNADQKAASNIVTQHIQGLKNHGRRKVVWRSFPHINTGFNLAAYCLVEEIKFQMEHCIKHDLPFPHTLFYQSDGGCENTAFAMFGLMEILVHYDVFERIEMNRIQVGHTHEDIDAMFGTIWTKIKQKTLTCPEDFKVAVLEALQSLGV